MRFSNDWLDLVLPLNSKIKANEIAEYLVSLGLEVEELIDRKSELEPFRIAEIIDVKPHPEATKLQICSVNTGAKVLQIVCGAPNARAGIKVVLAPVGTVIPNGGFIIKKSTIRGVESEGMLCSEEELLVSKDGSGIIELPKDAIVGNSYAEYVGLASPVFDISITPNRGDCWNVYGIARDLAAKVSVERFYANTNKNGLNANTPATFENCEIIDLTEEVQYGIVFDKLDNSTDSPSGKPSWKKLQGGNRKGLSNTDKCSSVYFAKISGIKNCDSPRWLKNLLKQVGIKSISAFVDITNFVAHTLGQPMHAYDAAKIRGELKVETLKTSQKFMALDTNKYMLEPGDIVIKDEDTVHSLAGIIGGADSSCHMDTTAIILEAAVFDRVQIFKTGMRLGIHTDSRTRFERGIDHEMTQKALELAVNLIHRYCSTNSDTSGTDFSDIEFMYQSDFIKKKTVLFNTNLIQKRLGLNLNLHCEKETKEECVYSDRYDILAYLLGKLGLKIVDKNDSRRIGTEEITLEIPTWRHDISIPEDITEEVARIIGYENLQAGNIPYSSNMRGMSQELKNSQTSRRVLASIGYNELVNYSFVDKAEASLFGVINDNLELLNPISSNMNYMRSSILHSLCNILHKNEQRFIDDLWLFEVGPIFLSEDAEITCVAAVKTIVERNEYISRELKQTFFDIKGDVEALLKELKVSGYQIKGGAAPYYNPYKSGSISLGKEILGYVGHVHPMVLKKLGIKSDVLAFELYLDKLPKYRLSYGKKSEYSVSDYPVVKRDFAFILEQNINIGNIISGIYGIEKKIIKKVELFDIYKLQVKQSSKHSVAIRVYIQDYKTMTENDIHELHAKIINHVEKNFGATLRM